MKVNTLLASALHEVAWWSAKPSSDDALPIQQRMAFTKLAELVSEMAGDDRDALVRAYERAQPEVFDEDAVDPLGRFTCQIEAVLRPSGKARFLQTPWALSEPQAARTLLSILNDATLGGQRSGLVLVGDYLRSPRAAPFRHLPHGAEVFLVGNPRADDELSLILNVRSAANEVRLELWRPIETQRPVVQLIANEQRVALSSESSSDGGMRSVARYTIPCWQKSSTLEVLLEGKSLGYFRCSCEPTELTY